jgi:hypothetical protein
MLNQLIMLSKAVKALQKRKINIIVTFLIFTRKRIGNLMDLYEKQNNFVTLIRPVQQVLPYLYIWFTGLFICLRVHVNNKG